MVTWNPQSFAQAHEALYSLGENASIASLKAILEPITDSLQKFLESPAKSDASRSKLAQKNIEIDGEVIEFNDVFMNDAAKVAEELNLDEVIASKLVFYAIEDARRLEIGVVEAAITLFYVRRQYIIDIIRFSLEVLPISHFDWVLSSAVPRIDQLVASLASVEQSLAGLKEKVKTSEFTGMSADPEFNQLLKLRNSFLVNEHESLGNVLFAYIDATTSDLEAVANSANSAKLLLDHVAGFEELDSRFMAYFNALSLWFTRFKSSQFNCGIWNYFHDTNVKCKWKLGYWFSVLKLAFYIGLDDVCMQNMPEVKLEQVLQEVRHVIDEGAIEFLMSYTQDISAQMGEFHFDKYRPLVRSRIPVLKAWKSGISALTATNYRKGMARIFIGFVTEYADILKEMRLCEEDMYLAMNELDEDAHTVSPGMDLERFFLMGGILFRGSPEQASLFFDEDSDDGDVLHGFLVWGSSCRATLMAAAFAELLGSLANDEANSASVFKFLLVAENSKADAKQASHVIEEGKSNYALHLNTINEGDNSTFAGKAINPVAAQGGTDDFQLSWNTMVGVFEYYTHTHNSKGQQAMDIPYSTIGSYGQSTIPAGSNFVMPNIVAPAPTPGVGSNTVAYPSSGLTSFHDRSGGLQPLVANEKPNLQYSMSQHYEQLSDDTLLVLSSYMELISRTALHNAGARQHFQGSDQLDSPTSSRSCVAPVLKLLRMSQPINGPIFRFLTSFVSDEIWRALNTTVLGRFDEMLTSLSDALDFITLLTELVKLDNLPPKFNEYMEFVFKTVFPWTTSDEARNSRSSLGVSAANIKRFKGRAIDGPVQSYEHTVDINSPTCKIYEASIQNVRMLIQKRCLQIAQCLLEKEKPNRIIFGLLFETKVYQPLFKIICTGMDELLNLESSHPLVESITIGVKVASLMLKLSKSLYNSFDKPILYHLQVIPHLALYAGSTHVALSLASVKLLSLLDNSNEFKATINRQSRILSILSSTSEATRIRVGLMSRMGDQQTPPAVKIAILEMLAEELQKSTSPALHMSVAHYLLGFRRSELGLELKLKLESGIGGIQSGGSLLMAICENLMGCLTCPNSDKQILRLCSVVIGHLCQDELTSEMVLDYMRQFDFWINTIKNEILYGETVIEPCDDVSQHRAIMLEVWVREIRLCQRRLLLTIESHYIHALIPVVFSLVDLGNRCESRVTLRCLRAWCGLIPVLLVGSGEPGSSSTDATFIATVVQRLVYILPQYSRQNANFAEPVASLLVALIEKFQDRGVDDVIARNFHSLLQSALESMQPAQMNACLRGYLYTLFCQCLKLSLLYGRPSTQQGALDIIVECGPKIFQIACDDILSCVNEELRFKALLFTQMSAVLDRRLNSKIVTQCLLRDNFVTIFILQTLGPVMNEAYRHHVLKMTRSDGANGASGSNGGNYQHNGEYNPLDRSWREDVDSGVLKSDTLNAYEENGKYPKQSNYKHHKSLKAGLSMLLPIAQVRDGAETLFASLLLTILKSHLGSFEDDMLLLSLQIMIAMLVSVGDENALTANSIKDVLFQHRWTLHDILQRDASLNRTLQDQSCESEVSLLAREATILISLTGLELTQS